MSLDWTQHHWDYDQCHACCSLFRKGFLHIIKGLMIRLLITCNIGHFDSRAQSHCVLPADSVILLLLIEQAPALISRVPACSSAPGTVAWMVIT